MEAADIRDAVAFQRFTRNLLAILINIEPFDVYPGHENSEKRIKFRNDPYSEFLRADDATQARISELAWLRMSEIFTAPDATA